MNLTINTHQAPTPAPCPIGPVSAPASPAVAPTPDPEAIQRGHLGRQARVTEWASLNLRQQWADADHMRDHLSAAGVRIGSNLEPATAARMRSVLRGAGVLGVESYDALGCGLEKFLKLNPALPLWAAVALVLEATGRCPMVPEKLPGRTG
jgi:hypothetical protein